MFFDEIPLINCTSLSKMTNLIDTSHEASVKITTFLFQCMELTRYDGVCNLHFLEWQLHITSLTVVHSGANQRKHQSSVSLAFVQGIRRWPVNSPAQRASNAENVSIWWRHHGNIFRVSNCWWVITCPSKCLLLPARNLSPETIMTKPTIFDSSVRHGNYQIMAFSLRYFHMCLIVNQVLLVLDRGLAPRTQQTDIKNKQWRSSVTRTYLHYLLIEAKTKRPPFVGDIFNYILLNKTISDRISDIVSLKYAL